MEEVSVRREAVDQAIDLLLAAEVTVHHLCHHHQELVNRRLVPELFKVVQGFPVVVVGGQKYREIVAGQAEGEEEDEIEDTVEVVFECKGSIV